MPAADAEAECLRGDRRSALVYSCSGSSSAAQLANDVAVRLHRLGLAEMSSTAGVGANVRSLVRKARSGRPVIAIDGCSAACSEKVLQAKGVRPAKVIRLSELGLEQEQYAELGAEEREALLARLLAALAPALQAPLRGCEPAAAESGGESPTGVAEPSGGRPRLRPGAEAGRTRRAHSIDAYLRTIHSLSSRVGERGPRAGDSPALAVHVSKTLTISRASAGEMLKRLEAEGLVARGHKKQVLLTREGRARAERAVRRHRLIERFLTDFVGYAPADSHRQAELLGDALDDEMVERMASQLGAPDRCPHGWPIDVALERAENPDLTALASVAPGGAGVIARLAEHDTALLHWLYDQDLAPGAQVEVCTAEPAADELAVRVGGEVRTISEKAAQAVFVRLSAVAARDSPASP